MFGDISEKRSRGREAARERGPGVPFPNWMGRSCRGRLFFCRQNLELTHWSRAPSAGSAEPVHGVINGSGGQRGAETIKTFCGGQKRETAPFLQIKVYISVDGLVDWLCLFGRNKLGSEAHLPLLAPLVFLCPRRRRFLKGLRFPFQDSS